MDDGSSVHFDIFQKATEVGRIEGRRSGSGQGTALPKVDQKSSSRRLGSVITLENRVIAKIESVVEQSSGRLLAVSQLANRADWSWPMRVTFGWIWDRRPELSRLLLESCCNNEGPILRVAWERETLCSPSACAAFGRMPHRFPQTVDGATL